jgi:FKBP-type peptidyl-prolyl cis-trans isomerase 2
MKKALIGLVILMVLLVGCVSNETSGNLTDNNVQSDSNSSGQGVDNLAQFRKVQAGDIISVHYAGKLEDGTMFDSSIGKSPLTFEVGADKVIQGFDKGVLGMMVGETKTITIPAAQAYGEYNPDYVQSLPISLFEQLEELVVGMSVTWNGMPGKVLEFDDNSVKVDFNHELAGKTLIFNVTLVSINN